MPPASFAEIRGGSLCALALLKAAEEFRKHPEGRALADQLTQMGLKLARGVARYGYDLHGYDLRERKFHKSRTLADREIDHLDKIAYSVNKEDIEYCIVPLRALSQ